MHAPDFVNSWLITSFGMHSSSGIGFARNPTHVRTIWNITLRPMLPYSVKRGEILSIPVAVFNHASKEFKADITLLNEKSEFAFYDDKKGISMLSISNTISTQVPANGVVVVNFFIVCKSIGKIGIKFVGAAGDSIVTPEDLLVVLPEGFNRHVNKAWFISLNEEKKSIQYLVDISIPEDAVPESAMIGTSGSGEILGLLIDNLSQLFPVPHSYGEENILNLALNSIMLNYLKKSGKLTDGLKTQMLRHMEMGYQQLLWYHGRDGSFNHFNEHDKQGSTFLTAFVLDWMLQAREHITIDDHVLGSMCDYLYKLQDEDGHFYGHGHMSEHPITLTAFVLIVLSKHQNQLDANAIILKAEKYILHEFEKITEPYMLSIVCYALQLTGNRAEDEAFEKLMGIKKADLESEKIWWVDEESSRSSHDDNYIASSEDIEATSYALMVLLLRHEYETAHQVSKWLISQQSFNGGFSTGRDTVVGVEALSEYSLTIISKESIEVVYDYGNGFSYTFKLNEGNSIVVQKQTIPSHIRHIKVSANGHGHGVIQVYWDYNLLGYRKTGNTFNIDSEIKKKGKLLQVKLAIS